MKLERALLTVYLAMAPVMAAGIRAGAGECVTVRLLGSTTVTPMVLYYAQQTSRRLFAEAGIALRWDGAGYGTEACLAIQAELGADAPPKIHREALAYALPYLHGGTEIHVLSSRVLRCPSARQNGVLLGYVLAHEIGHVLEGISRHSAGGVMKARWTGVDFAGMFASSLRFEKPDVDLMQAGFTARTSNTASLR